MNSADLDAARKRLDEVVEAFRRAAANAIDTASNPRATYDAVAEARTQTTFALAAIGLAFKSALHAARPGEPSA